ncbi:MAG: HK97 gp10 family phage protein [Prevotella sp.]|nr:HK97 gp10 family phage protein [Prevotella sp.]
MEQLIRITSKGDFNRTFKFLKKMQTFEAKQILERYAQMGVSALASATPVDSGQTASCWGYEIEVSGEDATIYWTNTNQNKGVYIAVILQYGHGTGTGGYVQGRDYINPAIRPVFDKIAEEAWREVTSA